MTTKWKWWMPGFGIIILVASCCIQMSRENCHRICVNQMFMLAAAVYNYDMINVSPFSNCIPLERVKQYLPNNHVPICPSGKLPYPDFNYEQGPVCPNGHLIGNLTWIGRVLAKMRGVIPGNEINTNIVTIGEVRGTPYVPVWAQKR